MTSISTTFASEELGITRHQYWQAAWIWMSKPHVVDKNLFGQKILRVFSCSDSKSSNAVIEKLTDVVKTEQIHLEQYLLDAISLDESLQPCSQNDMRMSSEGSFLFIKRLLLKKMTVSIPIEICFINYLANEALFYNMTPKLENMPPYVASFILRFKNDRIEVQILQQSGRFKDEWFKFVLLPKLTKWAKESSADACNYQEDNRGSLNLIAPDCYNELYLMWKEKYGKELIEKWCESTDPLKFVHEDIAIAAYLCSLWANNKISFVDLGCGNGLLVHILTQEGHRGYGIDIRSRKIWSTYPTSTKLKVGTVTPEDNCIYPDADWLIGNHSDELTPWIPIFAARSSSRCKFFLLPCCAYQLSGEKFQRRSSLRSTYSDYIDYVVQICRELGFHTSIDRLRIPSTKRTCLIGNRAPLDESVPVEEKVLSVLSKHLRKDFVPREPVEKVRNCTKVDRSITSKICDTISRTLIQRQLALSRSADIWSTNYSLKLEEAVSILDPSDLKKLKNECGGLQTLLRNNHSVFIVQRGNIYFRKPSEKIRDTNKWKLKPCWFYNNHPMKCPLSEDKCSFMH